MYIYIYNYIYIYIHMYVHIYIYIFGVAACGGVGVYSSDVYRCECVWNKHIYIQIHVYVYIYIYIRIYMYIRIYIYIFGVAACGGVGFYSSDIYRCESVRNIYIYIYKYMYMYI